MIVLVQILQRFRCNRATTNPKKAPICRDSSTRLPSSLVFQRLLTSIRIIFVVSLLLVGQIKHYFCAYWFAGVNCLKRIELKSSCTVTPSIMGLLK